MALKTVVDEAVKMAPSVEKIFIMDRTGTTVNPGPKDIQLEKVGQCLSL